MNARGILPATQQVFAVLICPSQGAGVPTLAGGTYPGGYLPWLGVPTLAAGYLPWPGGVPTQARGTYPGRGTDRRL